MPIAAGDRLPDVKFFVIGEAGPKPLSTAEVFGGKTSVIIGVPGAFTPTCHKTHLPGFLKEAENFKARGVDQIVVIAVNDPWVMQRWEEETGASGKIRFLSDGNAEFAKATGLDADISVVGFGTRLKRCSMLVKDGVVDKINIEVERGAVNLSSAETLMCQL